MKRSAKQICSEASKRWNNSLLAAINDRSLIVMKNDLITIIKDKYPKSRHHFLVIPTETLINSVTELTPKDIHLLEMMSNLAKDLALKTDEKSEFRFGFHIIPSLRPLHLHVISQDFDSNCLKTRKHYNSFTTRFFIDIETVINDLKSSGEVSLLSKEECDKLLKGDLICHRCSTKLTNIPQLKQHLLTHISN